MGRSWFVAPETVRLALSDDQWLDVKKRLTVGEERAAFQQIVGEVNTEGWRRPNFEMIGLAEVAAYIVRWSLVDDQGLQVPFSVQALQHLDPLHYKEIEDVVGAHIKRVDADLAAQKNGTGGATGPVPISPFAAP